MWNNWVKASVLLQLKCHCQCGPGPLLQASQPHPLCGLIFLKILSLIVNLGVDTIGIRFRNWKILKKVVTNFSSGGHQVVWILVLVQVMFDCFQAWKLAQNQAWKQSNMACSTSAEEDFQARAAQLLLLHWSYSHQPDFLDEDTEQSTGAQMHC